MKRALLALLLLPIATVAFAVSQSYMLLPIISVYDGDTIKTDLTWRIPYPLNKTSIRINGIDTPEMPAKSYAITGLLGRAKCVEEAELALKARARVVEIAEGHKKMKVRNFKWGKYGGRILGDVTINGIDIRQTLLDEGFAVEYYGKGAKKDWCSVARLTF